MIREAANKLIETFYQALPYQTAVHVANAQKELLLAAGSVIEEQIKWTDIHLERAHGRTNLARPENPSVTVTQLSPE